MKIIFQLTADDYVHANRLSLKPRPLLRYVGYGLAALFILFIAWQGYELSVGKGSLAEFLAIVCVVAYLLVQYYVLLPRRIRRLFKQQKTLHSLQEAEFTDTHFIGSSEHGTFKMAWGDFHKWKKDKNLILVYQSAILMHMLPLRAFASPTAVAEFVSILERHLGPQKV